MLACPKCEKEDHLRTIETMEAEIACEAITPEGPQYDPGREIVYDSTSVAGVACECGWSYRGPDWISHLL